jgi:hypothetical protein
MLGPVMPDPDFAGIAGNQDSPTFFTDSSIDISWNLGSCSLRNLSSTQHLCTGNLWAIP